MNRSLPRILAAVALLVITSTLEAQVKPLKENLLKLLDLLPPPCSSLEEALAKCADPAASGGCSATRIMAPFTLAYEAKSADRMATGTSTNSSQEAMMQKMQDPAFQAEMQKMTPDQLVALSMQLQGGSLPMSGIPTDEETAMAEEFSRINEDLMDFAMKYTNEWAQLQSTFEERKRAIEQARWEEVKKCPTETSGEVTYTSPACCAAVEKKYDEQWRTAVGEWVPKANDVVARHRAAVLARYGEAEKRMAALGYGDKCGVQMFLDMVTSTQTAILGSLGSVSDMAGQVWKTTCENRVGIDHAMICP